MCTIFKYKNTVGRNFDYEETYKETIKKIPATNNPFTSKYDIIGVGTDYSKYPLLYDGMNSNGLVVGGLAFKGNAKYKHSNKNDKLHIPSYDFTLRVLSECGTVEEVKELLQYVKITDAKYQDFEATDLHWFIADNDESVIVEQTESSLNIYNGSVMTNNPNYWLQKNWNNSERFDIGVKPKHSLKYVTRGENTYNLKGDYTSMGRFQRLSWLKEQLEQIDNDFNPVSQAFHLLNSVEQVYGATPVKDKYEYTIYNIVYDLENKKLYLKFYDSLQIEEVKL